MIREIVTYPNPILRWKSKPVERYDQSLIDLAKDMLETMYAGNGVGLAAPQVGESICLIVVDVSENRSSPLILVNPVITDHSGAKAVVTEGCLSFPKLAGRDLKSFAAVTIKFNDLGGKEKTLNASGLLAACLQHEIDHLKGKLMIDRKPA